MASEQARSDDDRRALEWRQRQTLTPSTTARVVIKQAATLPDTHPRRPVALPTVSYEAAPTSRPAGRPDVHATSSAPGRPDVEASKATTPIGTDAGRPDVPSSSSSNLDPFEVGLAQMADALNLDDQQRAAFGGLADLLKNFGPRS